MLLTCFAGFACSRPSHAATDLPAPEVDLQVEASDEPQAAIAVLAGGCFWCTEAVFEELEGVSSVVSGYAGGTEDDANYKGVSAGITDHAEVIAITYDPGVISYGQLLQVFFAVAHNPTHVNRQGNDVGRQYRSAVFFASEDEKRVAEAYIAQLTAANVFDAPIATTLEPLTRFFPAEDYHQNYAALNPRQPYVAYTSLPKVDKLRKQFPDLLKSEKAAE
ncbi:MAG: peptide-methionine (S)-S-oxide reductase MsrA [Planctomycetota bacterium]